MCSVLAWAGAGGAVCGVGAGVCGGVGVRVPSCGSAAEVIVDIVKPTDRAITVFGALVAVFAEDCKEAGEDSGSGVSFVQELREVAEHVMEEGGVEVAFSVEAQCF